MHIKMFNITEEQVEFIKNNAEALKLAEERQPSRPAVV
jgi:hypothetical protein